MSGDVHVRFCERLGGRVPGATRLVLCFQYREDALRTEMLGYDIRFRQWAIFVLAAS